MARFKTRLSQGGGRGKELGKSVSRRVCQKGRVKEGGA